MTQVGSLFALQNTGPPETLKTYKLGSTPQTIVISAEGKVLQDWVGAYVGESEGPSRSIFSCELAGAAGAAEGDGHDKLTFLQVFILKVRRRKGSI